MLCWLAAVGAHQAKAADLSGAPPPPPAPAPAITAPAPGSLTLITSPTVYAPDLTHAHDPLPDSVLFWDAAMKTLDASNSQADAQFVFNVTNVSTGPVTIISAEPSCHCTQAKLPVTPWLLPPGAGGQIKVSVDLRGKMGSFFKSVAVTTDKGLKTLLVRVSIAPAPVHPMTAAELANGIAAAKVDRQAVFHGDCAQCHNKDLPGKYGPQLFAAACAICHEAEHRASMVPDLHHLAGPTGVEFWRVWITAGKPGSLMPAFAKAQGGPLDDLQIASLAQYLNAINPSAVNH
jgi:cytochrome c553